MTTFEFQSEFLEMEKEDSAKAAKLLQDYTQFSTFSMVSNLKEFSNLTDQISELCFELNEVGGPSEDEFYSLVENISFQLQNCFNCFYDYTYSDDDYTYTYSYD